MTSSGDQRGNRWRGVGRLLNRRSTTLRAVAIACLLPVPVAFAAPPGIVDSLESASRALFSPPHDLELPVGHLASDFEPMRDVGFVRDGVSAAGTDAGVVTVPSSKARVRAASLEGDYDIPAAALHAYREAAATLQRTDPACRLDWALLAGIGRVESDHGRYAGTTVHDDGTTSPHILGVPLDGSPGVAAISDSDGGELDGDTVWDRAVGPMQFIPTTWSMMAADGDGDGRSNPHDLDDAALAAGVYLCAGDSDLSTQSGAEAAVFRYNHSDEYVDLVLSLAKAYRSGVVAVPSTPATGNGSAPTLDEIPDANANGEQPSAPTDRNGDDQRSPDKAKQEQPADRDESPAPERNEPAETTERPQKPDNDDKAPAGGGDTDGSKDDEGHKDKDRDGEGDGDGSTDDGSTEEQDPPTPEPEPEPETVQLSGVITVCEDSLCVSTTTEDDQDTRSWTLDLAEVGDTTASEDFDGDESTESIRDELLGVAEHDEATVTLDVQKDGDVGVATVAQLVDAKIPESEDGSAEPRTTELTGSLDEAGPPQQRTFTESGPDAQTWVIDFSRVGVTTIDVDGDGMPLDDELAAMSERDELNLTIMPGGDDSADVVALAELNLEELDITVSRLEENAD